MVIDWRAGMALPFYRPARPSPMGVRAAPPVRLPTRRADRVRGRGPGRRAADRGPLRRSSSPRSSGRAPARCATSSPPSSPSRTSSSAPGSTSRSACRARPGTGQDRGRAAPRRLPALRPPRPAGPLGRAGRRPERQLPVLHRRRAPRARRDRRQPDHRRRRWSRDAHRRWRSAAPTRRRRRCSRATPGWPRCVRRAVWGHLAPARPSRWSCRAASTSGGSRAYLVDEMVGELRARGRAVRRRPRDARRSGSRTRCCCGWRRPATPPTTGCRTRWPAAARSRRTSTPALAGRSTRPKLVLRLLTDADLPGRGGRRDPRPTRSRPSCWRKPSRAVAADRGGRWPTSILSTRWPTWSTGRPSLGHVVARRGAGPVPDDAARGRAAAPAPAR